MTSRNQLLIDAIEEAGGTVTDPTNRNALLLDLVAAISGVSPASVVESVTGERVDNTDESNPVILPRAHIVMESTTSQAISTDQANPTVLDNWTVLSSSGISLQGDSIRNDTGRDIAAMAGTIGVHPLVDGGGGSRLLNITSESSVDGVTYTINDQNRPIFTTNNAETYNTKESYLVNFGDGVYVRFIAHADAAITIAPSSTLFRNIATSGPASLWILVEV